MKPSVFEALPVLFFKYVRIPISVLAGGEHYLIDPKIMFINLCVAKSPDIVPILPGATSSLHPTHSFRRFYSATVWEGVILLTALTCVVLSLWSYNIIFTIGVTAKLMGYQGRYGVSKPHSSAEV